MASKGLRIMSKKPGKSVNNFGVFKKSFSLYYNGGEIWAEHLDGIAERNTVMRKYYMDLEQIRKPSSSSFIAINLDETKVDPNLLEQILTPLCQLNRPIKKVVLVGLDWKWKRYIRKRKEELPFQVGLIDDFEKAKQWLLGNNRYNK
ncbi:hypothetical protein [Anaerosporobacter faecicola]|uniref:hypothetical protein n=1 Tax=Anaerosporobacter faecicola TaxID=2718714 RepID=UPI00143B4DCD|nr:hypothetical protein [Anaerosporobacter faecicola]